MEKYNDFDFNNIDHIDLHNHTVGSYKTEIIANLSTKKTLEYYQSLAEKDGNIIFAITDHNNTLSGIEAIKEYNANREKYKNIIPIAGVEVSTRLNSSVTYDIGDDYRCLFKSMHTLAYCDINHQDEWVNNKELNSFSKLFNFNVSSKSYGDENINIGNQILASRNTIKSKLGVTIPFEELSRCIMERNPQAMRNAFLDIACNHLRKSTLEEFKGKSNNEIISKLYSPIFKVSDENREVIKNEMLSSAAPRINNLMGNCILKNALITNLTGFDDKQEIQNIAYSYIVDTLHKSNNKKFFNKSLSAAKRMVALENGEKIPDIDSEKYKTELINRLCDTYSYDFNTAVIDEKIASIWNKKATNKVNKDNFYSVIIPLIEGNANRVPARSKLRDMIEKTVFTTNSSAKYISLEELLPHDPKKMQIIGSCHELDIKELSEITQKAHAHLCYAHYDINFNTHKKSRIPLGAFRGVDLSFLCNKTTRDFIKSSLDDPKIPDTKLLNQSILDDDLYDLVKLGLLHVNNLKKGIIVEAVELDKMIMQNPEHISAVKKFCLEYNLKLSFGTDTHMNTMHEKVQDYFNGKITADELYTIGQKYTQKGLICSHSAIKYLKPTKLMNSNYSHFKPVVFTRIAKEKYRELTSAPRKCAPSIKSCSLCDMLLDRESKSMLTYVEGESVSTLHNNNMMKPLFKNYTPVVPMKNNMESYHSKRNKNNKKSKKNNENKIKNTEKTNCNTNTYSNKNKNKKSNRDKTKNKDHGQKTNNQNTKSKNEHYASKSNDQETAYKNNGSKYNTYKINSKADSSITKSLEITNETEVER